MSRKRSIRRFNEHIVGSAAIGLPLLTRINAFLALDQLELRPVLDGLDHLRHPDDRGKYVVCYELREPGAAGRRNIGIVSKTFLAALGRMRPGKMAEALDLGNRGRA